MTLLRSPVAVRRLVMLGALACLLLCILSVATVRHTIASAAALRASVAESQERINRLNLLLMVLLDAEVGQRGYALTGNPSFLQPYESARRRLSTARVALQDMDARQTLRLSALMDRKLRFMAHNVALRRDRGGRVAAHDVERGEGKRLMDSIRAEIASLSAAERRKLAQLEERRVNRERGERLTIYAALFGAFAIAAGIGLMLMRELRHRAMAERMARRRSLFLRGTLENLDHGVALLDRDGNIVERNDKLAVFLARSGGKPALTPEVVEAARAGAPLRREMSEEEGRCIEIRGRPTPEESYVVTYTDISERRRMEKMKTAFVSNVSHELRTPLTSIRASLGLMAGPLKSELPERIVKLVTIADRNALRLLTLVNDLLDLDKIESGKMVLHLQSIDLNVAAEEAAEANRAYAEARGVAIALGRTSRRAIVMADPARIQQVMANLLSNAAKFSTTGQIVVISVEQTGEEARLTVQDSGPGIPEEFRAHIFEKFSQAKTADSNKVSGSGLGLNIAKAIVESHGGVLDYGSRPGSTEFWFTLPLYKGDQTGWT